ncbi:YbfB/YjiJ family MFS transporter [Candidimonas sp. SYP-B2681]|nr:YbfB/YjiJ family MFS transporter [Candidimonas sp. SYP-B2681]RTZ47648.1 YbfB/YjiJ family MFS transporter [Candidimonas sp. SYP-B2681]
MKPAMVPWALSGGAAVAVGFARFAYALILPAMKTDLDLNYAQAGWLNTANALGYLIGALLTIFFVSGLGNRRLFISGLWLTTLALVSNGLTHDFYLLTLFRFLAGFGAAGAFICGGVLSGVLGTRAIVIFFSGGGFGMLVSGALLPWLFDYGGAAAWPWAWVAIAAVCIPLSLAAASASRGITEPSAAGTSAAWPWRPCVPEFAAYFMFGLGYIAYMTFIVAWLNLSPHSDHVDGGHDVDHVDLIGNHDAACPTAVASDLQWSPRWFTHGRVHGRIGGRRRPTTGFPHHCRGVGIRCASRFQCIHGPFSGDRFRKNKPGKTGLGQCTGCRHQPVCLGPDHRPGSRWMGQRPVGLTVDRAGRIGRNSGCRGIGRADTEAFACR